MVYPLTYERLQNGKISCTYYRNKKLRLEIFKFYLMFIIFPFNISPPRKFSMLKQILETAHEAGCFQNP